MQELGMQRVESGGPANTTTGVESSGAVGCGDTTCSPTDLCIAIAIGAAARDSNDASPPTIHYECSAAPVQSTAAITCTLPSGGRQSCSGAVVAPAP
jgi:hypothetical protein